LDSINFINSQGYTESFTISDLDNILFGLTAYDSNYTSGLNSLMYLRLKASTLLLIDLTSNNNLKLFENFDIAFDSTFPLNIRFIASQSA
jgi:hypothetical protein